MMIWSLSFQPDWLMDRMSRGIRHFLHPAGESEIITRFGLLTAESKKPVGILLINENVSSKDRQAIQTGILTLQPLF
jgi:hypothetical protein